MKLFCRKFFFWQNVNFCHSVLEWLLSSPTGKRILVSLSKSIISAVFFDYTNVTTSSRTWKRKVTKLLVLQNTAEIVYCMSMCLQNWQKTIVWNWFMKTGFEWVEILRDQNSIRSVSPTALFFWAGDILQNEALIDSFDKIENKMKVLSLTNG